MQTAAPSSPSSAPRPSVFQGQAVATVIGGEAKRRKSEDIPRGFPVPSSETCMAPGNVKRLIHLPSLQYTSVVPQIDHAMPLHLLQYLLSVSIAVTQVSSSARY